MDKFLLYILALLIIALGCSPSKLLSKTTSLGDPQNAQTFGYQPLDPLPVNPRFFDRKLDSAYYYGGVIQIPNNRLMGSLPDETMRLAIGQADGKGNASFGPAKIGYAGNSYVVVIDYIKFDTKSFPVMIKVDSLNNIKDFIPYTLINNPDGSSNGFNPDGVIPVYVGVGLRFSATIKVNEGSVDLGNLFALGIAAEAKQITGTLIVQTLGISGKDISSLIPIPSQLNTTTIQNAIMAIATIKAKIYDDSTQLNPRIVGFYNNLGGGQTTVNKFISSVLSKNVDHIIR
ncbi:hypothetical protein [Spirosoma fluviale]|uniref:Uncharacterized protein n=1 Tax=Spirosoma fluviale TaxID=1597977 RepID=A0A286FCM3_9BACT|nr:hypothetical protein [Spirosoma fluviale]SOD80978.1 hypothetical protein SAMN06269250_1631 [Spirosoma fluviale]